MVNLEIVRMERPNNLSFIQEMKELDGQVLLFDKQFDARFTDDAKTKTSKEVFVYDKKPSDFIKSDRYKAYQLIGAKTPDGWVVGIEPVSEDKRLKPNCFGLIRVNYYRESEAIKKIGQWEHQINSAMNDNQWLWKIHESFGMTFDEAFGFNSKEEALIDAMKRHDISQYRVFYDQQDITASVLNTVAQVQDGKQITGPVVLEKGEIKQLLIPYDVTFEYRGQTITRRLFNCTDGDTVASFYDYPDEVFCAHIDGEETCVEVYEQIAEDEPYQLKEKVKVKDIQPVIRNECRFRIENAWEADGKWGDRPMGEAIWQKAREIYPDEIDLETIYPEAVGFEIDAIMAECDKKFREAGATDEEIALAPDLTLAAVQYVGRSGFAFNANDYDGAVMFLEGNLDVGYNVSVNFEADYHCGFDQVRRELCDAYDVKNVSDITDSRVQCAIDAMKSHTVHWYVAPDETLGQAIKRHFTDSQTQFVQRKRGGR